MPDKKLLQAKLHQLLANQPWTDEEQDRKINEPRKTRKKRVRVRGFVNDKTLGDATLTAAPPAVYAVQPNILTAYERNDIKNLEGANTAFKTATDSLYATSRNPFNFTGQDL